MKRIVLTTLMLISITVISAQNFQHKIGIGANLGLPVGEFADSYKTGYGGYLKVLLGVSEDGYITFTSGYSSHALKSSSTIYFKSGTAAIIPIMAGYRHNFSGFYIEPQIGLSNYRLNLTGIGGTVVKSHETGFTFCAGIGYSISGFDIGARYEGGSVDLSRFSLVGLRIGYNINLSKSGRN